jgi:hypothetical protein
VTPQPGGAEADRPIPRRRASSRQPAGTWAREPACRMLHSSRSSNARRKRRAP